jgi:hypothetical protein
MKKILFLLLALPLLVMGQWNQTYFTDGQNNTTNAIQTADGGYLISGSHIRFRESFSEGPCYFSIDGGGYNLKKTDDLGNVDWSKDTYIGWDYGYLSKKVKNVSDSSFIVLYSSEDYGAYYSGMAGNNYYAVNLYLLNDSSASIVDSYQFSNTGINYNFPTVNSHMIFNDIKTTLDSGFILCGDTLFKLNQSLDSVWSYPTLLSNSVIQKDDGSFLLSGNLDSTFFLQKRGVNGDSLWTKYYSLNTITRANEVINTSDGGFAVIGKSKDNINRFDVLLVKLDSLGNVQWHNSYGDIFADAGSSIIQNLNDEFVFVGTIAYDVDNNKQVFFVKTDNNGNQLSLIKYGNINGGNSFAKSVVQTFDGGYIIGASKWNEKWLIKTDSNGATEINENNFKSFNKKLIKITNILGQETTPKSNTPLIYLYDDGTVEKKIIIE